LYRQDMQFCKIIQPCIFNFHFIKEPNKQVLICLQKVSPEFKSWAYFLFINSGISVIVNKQGACENYVKLIVSEIYPLLPSCFRLKTQ